MGKKSRSKHQRQNQQAQKKQAQAPVATPTSTILGSKLAAAQQGKVLAQVDYEYVRNDIRRILILLVVMIAILATAVIVNSRTSLLQRAGSSVASFLKLQ